MLYSPWLFLPLTMLKLFRHTLEKFSTVNNGQLTAALSFHVFFAVAPLLFMAVAIFGMIVDVADLQHYVMEAVQQYTSGPIVTFMQDLLAVVTNRNVNLFALVIGTVTMLLGLMGVTGSIMEMFEAVWKHENNEESLISQVKRSGIAALALATVGATFVGTMMLRGVLELVWKFAAGYIPLVNLLAVYTNDFLIWGVLFITLALLFKYAPSKNIRWKYVWVPAGVTAFLLYILKTGFELYIAYAGLANAYGAASSLFLVLIWMQMASTVLLFGICMCQAMRRRHYTRR